MIKKLVLCLLLLGSLGADAFAQGIAVMPVPAIIIPGDQRFQLDQNFRVVMNDVPGSRAADAVSRFLFRLDNRTHLLIAKTFLSASRSSGAVSLLVTFNRRGSNTPGEDESYSLRVTGDRVLLNAETDLGVLHGLETFLQLVDHDALGYFLKGAEITDKPRFPWRGLMIDAGRHFMPVEVIRRNIDGMAMMKMNVLHLHLSEDQGFRMESKKFPALHEQGSNGNYYSMDDMKELIHYADQRGIMIVPEFDMPGHATSWMVGYPFLASAKGPYEIEKKFGVFDPVMDPARRSTYRFLKKFICEMNRLFPGDYFHIGGDENNGKQWDANKEIQKFKEKKKLRSNHELQGYFNKKISGYISKNHKNMIGWDEILVEGLPSQTIIQSWRGKEGIKDAASKGYRVILSNGYYIDLLQPAWKYYMNDPLPADQTLNESEQKLVLGGEATMWSELVTPETVDSRIWPVTSAIAERLWSPREVNNIPDMYKRLDRICIQLEEAGLQHRRNQEMMIRRISGNDETEPLLQLVAVVEPLKDYNRHNQGIAYSTDLPFTRLPDIAFPESKEAREFQLLCEAFVKKKDLRARKPIEERLNFWIRNYDNVVRISEGNPALAGWVRMARQLKNGSLTALECIDFIDRRIVVTDEWARMAGDIFDEAAMPVEESEIAVLNSFKLLYRHALNR